MIGQRAISGVILFEIRVEKVDGDGVSSDAFKVIAPRTHQHRPAFDGYFDRRVFEHQQLFDVPGLFPFRLHAHAVQVLLKISLAVQQTDGAEP